MFLGFDLPILVSILQKTTASLVRVSKLVFLAEFYISTIGIIKWQFYFTVIPRHEATQHIGERPNLYLENVNHLIGYPQ